MSEATDYFAERVIGERRENCSGSMGHGAIGPDGQIISHTFCCWCGRKFRDGSAAPCPEYKFRNFTLEGAMAALGKLGYAILVRYDPWRSTHCFTLIDAYGRITDTDEPLEALCKWAMKKGIREDR